MGDAGHAENDPGSSNPLIVQVACAVPDRLDGEPLLSGRIALSVTPGTLLHRIAGRERLEEVFTCSYELAPRFRSALEQGGLVVSAVGEQGDVRAVELPGLRWHLATLFQPQISSTAASPHPIVLAFLTAACRYRDERTYPPALS